MHGGRTACVGARVRVGSRERGVAVLSRSEAFIGQSGSLGWQGDRGRGFDWVEGGAKAAILVLGVAAPSKELVRFSSSSAGLDQSGRAKNSNLLGVGLERSWSSFFAAQQIAGVS